jgi:hypothetical protein
MEGADSNALRFPLFPPTFFEFALPSFRQSREYQGGPSLIDTSPLSPASSFLNDGSPLTQLAIEMLTDEQKYKNRLKVEHI